MATLREATKLDATEWWTLWQQFLQEHDKYTIDRLGLESKDFWDSVFFSYTSGSKDGLVIFAEENSQPIGVLVGGEPPYPPVVPTKLGRCCHLMGCWVDPAHRLKGLNSQMGLRLIQWGLKLGFDTFVTTVYTGNQVSDEMTRHIGGQPYAINYAKSAADFKGPKPW